MADEPSPGSNAVGPHPGRSEDADLAFADPITLRREVDRLRDALAESRSRERALLYELQHRVRNVLSIIRTLHRRTRESRPSQEEVAEHFEGRLNAVARYQMHVADAVASGMDVEDMLRDELLETFCLDTPRCIIAGAPVNLRGRPAELMGLAIHELTTNAVKFGFLAHGGTLKVGWSLDERSTGTLLRFSWVESGVPIAGLAPRSSGFGRQLIEEGLPYQIDATTTFDLKPGGLACAIVVPLPAGVEA